jgi:hypothetical protein
VSKKLCISYVVFLYFHDSEICCRVVRPVRPRSKRAQVRFPVIYKHLIINNMRGCVRWNKGMTSAPTEADDVIWTPYQSSSGGRAVTSRHALHVEGGVSQTSHFAKFWPKNASKSSKWSGFWRFFYSLHQIKWLSMGLYYNRLGKKKKKPEQFEWSQYGLHTWGVWRP